MEICSIFIVLFICSPAITYISAPTNNSGNPVYPSSISCSGATLTQICAPSVERTALVVYQLTDLTSAVTITHGTTVGYSGNLTLIGIS